MEKDEKEKEEIKELDIREKRAITEQIEADVAYQKELTAIDIKVKGQEIIRRNIEACNSVVKVWKDEEALKDLAKEKALKFVEALSI